MTTQRTLFPSVTAHYESLLTALGTAESTISMMYYAFDSGEWAEKFSNVLTAKARSGVQVRFMADGFGQVIDNYRHVLKNWALARNLRKAGIDLKIFSPRRKGLNKFNRLHCKMCAIDQRTAFIGGSNVGDYYTTWDDSNLRLDGELGSGFHNVFEYIWQFSNRQKPLKNPELKLSNLFAGDSQICLTIPKKRQDIRLALTKLIHKADKFIYIRAWCFLPEREILRLLRSKAEAGVDVNVLLSHKSRTRPVDFANYSDGHQLILSGGKVFRYTQKYLHSKVVWNNHGDILFGSANLSCVSMQDTFECSIFFRDPEMTKTLQSNFEADMRMSFQQTPEMLHAQPAYQKAVSYALNLVLPRN